MAQRVVHDCDGCNRELTEPITVWVDVGTSSDPCEGSVIDSIKVDICPKCAQKAIQAILKPMDFGAGARWLKAIKKPA